MSSVTAIMVLSSIKIIETEDAFFSQKFLSQKTATKNIASLENISDRETVMSRSFALYVSGRLSLSS